MLTRVLGAATVAYSVAIIVSPGVLARPCAITEPDGTVAPGLRTLIGAMGARDVVIGTAMMVAPQGKPSRTAAYARAAADLTDAVVFGATLPDRTARGKAIGVAVGWAALCALSARPWRRVTD